MTFKATMLLIKNVIQICVQSRYSAFSEVTVTPVKPKAVQSRNVDE